VAEFSPLAAKNPAGQVLFISAADETEVAIGPGQARVGSFVGTLLDQFESNRAATANQLLQTLCDRLQDNAMSPRLLTHNLPRDASLADQVLRAEPSQPPSAPPWPAGQVSDVGNVAPALTKATGWQTVHGLSLNVKSSADVRAEGLLKSGANVRLLIVPHTDLWLYLIAVAPDGTQTLLRDFWRNTEPGNLTLAGWQTRYELTLTPEPGATASRPAVERLRIIAAPERLDEPTWRGVKVLPPTQAPDWNSAVETGSHVQPGAAQAPGMIQLTGAETSHTWLLASPESREHTPPLALEIELRHAP
jgi:hypothetical protein